MATDYPFVIFKLVFLFVFLHPFSSLCVDIFYARHRLVWLGRQSGLVWVASGLGRVVWSESQSGFSQSGLS